MTEQRTLGSEKWENVMLPVLHSKICWYLVSSTCSKSNNKVRRKIAGLLVMEIAVFMVVPVDEYG